MIKQIVAIFSATTGALCFEEYLKKNIEGSAPYRQLLNNIKDELNTTLVESDRLSLEELKTIGCESIIEKYRSNLKKQTV